jgi:iron(III) transport system substrate-binding protein
MNRAARIVPAMRSAVSRRTFLHGSATAAGVLALAGSLPRGASAEETLVWYTGSAVEAVDDWVELFTKQSGIPCEYYRAGGLKIAQKFEQEVKAGQVGCSLIGSGLVGLLMQWIDRGLLLEYQSPEHVHYPEDATIPGYAWPIKADPMVMIYNTEVLTADEAPKHWEEILDSKWKGQMTMSDATSSSGALNWYASLRKAFGVEFMEALAEQDVLVRTGSGEVVNTVVSRERPLAAMVHQYHSLAAANKGAKLRVITPEEGVPVGYTYLSIAADGPTPEAAKKFIDFALGQEAQTVWQNNHFTLSLRDDAPALGHEYGAVPLSQVKRLASSRDDHLEYFEQNAMLADEWSLLFK